MSDLPEINRGDIVRLRSGGPSMTVRSVLINNKTNQRLVFVEWFVNGVCHSGTFDSRSLEIPAGKERA